MTKSCVNELKAVSVPKIVLNCVILATSLYFLYQAYYKQKWDPELKYEYTVFVAFIAICNFIYIILFSYMIIKKYLI